MINLTIQHLLKNLINPRFTFFPEFLAGVQMPHYLYKIGGRDLNFFPIFLREAMSVQATKPLPSKHCPWNPWFLGSCTF